MLALWMSASLDWGSEDVTLAVAEEQGLRAEAAMPATAFKEKVSE